MLTRLGDPESVRQALRTIVAGPQPATRAEIAAQLVRLSYHYWRPDFSPRQAALVVDDFLRDLADATAADVEEACDAYRRDPKHRFFPTPGQLLDLMAEALNARARLRRGAQRCLDALATAAADECTTGPRDFAALKALLAIPAGRV